MAQQVALQFRAAQGFGDLVAVAQASNQVLARGLAGSVPPFSLAFFRWSIIAIGLAPFAVAAIRDGKIARVTTYYNLSDWTAQVSA